MSAAHKPRIAILASGSGTTAEAYARGIHDGITESEIGLVISSKPSAGILDRAARWNADWTFDVRTEIVNNWTHPKGPRKRGQSEESAEAICELLDDENIDLVLQLGYMVIANDPYIEEWGFVPDLHDSVYYARALNWHPGILPLTADTYGANAAQVMLDAFKTGRITEAMHTIHAVAQEVDAGPIVAEHPVPIMPNDTKETLFARTHLVEEAITPYAADRFLRQQEMFNAGIAHG